VLAMQLGTEVLWWAMFCLVYGTGAAAGWQILHRVSLPPPLALLVALLGAVVAAIVVAGLLARLLPSIRPGTYGTGEGRMHLAWGLRYLLTRVLFLGPMLPFIQFSMFLRWLAWRALGASVELGSMSSSDIPLPDMPLVRCRRGSVIGSRSRLSTHLMMGGTLTLGRIELGAGAVVGADCNLSPNVVVGDRSILSYGVLVAQDVTIGADVFIGKLVMLGSNVTIGDGAVVETESKVPNDTVVPPGGRWVNPKDGRAVGHLELPEQS